MRAFDWWVNHICGSIFFDFHVGERQNKYRDAKFKMALRLQFWLLLQNLFCRFLTSKLWSDLDMINPSIESSDFLFWHVKNFLSLIFENLCETDKVISTSSNLMCIYTHSKFQNMEFSLSVSHKIFKIWVTFFLMSKYTENQSLQLMG